MNNLKDSLNENRKTVTLSASQIDFLNRVHQMMQLTLEQLKERVAAEYLHQLAVDQFGMDASKDFNFEFHPEREFDNLIITEKIVQR